jgi:F0F1-type ATP synthase membrane subunit b/b'
MRGWQWANFIVLAGVLAYFGVKFGKPYFDGQTQIIRKGLDEARVRREEAERRSAEVQAKLNNLGAEIASFRQNVLAEQNMQAERMRKQAETDLLQVNASAVQQIETLGKHLRLDLKRYASRLALELAEQRLRSRMTPSEQQVLTNRFVQDLKA